MFRIAVESVNGRLVPVKMPGWQHDLLAMADAARREKAKLVYLPNPNNPTGTCVTAAPSSTPTSTRCPTAC